MKYYSKSTHGFYDSIVHGERGDPGSLVPTDAVDISDDEYTELFAAQAQGKVIAADAGGNPIAIDRVFTADERAATARAARDAQLAVADNKVNALEDAGQDTTAWRQYRQALRNWPAAPGFPDLATLPAQPA